MCVCACVCVCVCVNTLHIAGNVYEEDIFHSLKQMIMCSTPVNFVLVYVCIYISLDAGGTSSPPTSELPTATGGQEQQGTIATAGEQEDQGTEQQEGEKSSEESASAPQEQQETEVVAASSEQQPDEGEGEKGEEHGGIATEEAQETADTKTTCSEGKICIKF